MTYKNNGVSGATSTATFTVDYTQTQNEKAASD